MSYTSYQYSLPSNFKKSYFIQQIKSDPIGFPQLIDVLVYNTNLQVIFTTALTAPQETTLNTLAAGVYNPLTDPYPIYTEEYYVKVSTSDQQANYLSSSLLASNNIRYSIINPGTDEKYQSFVNTSDGVIGTDVIWSSYYINSLIGSDINDGIAQVLYYLSSSISICY